MEQSRFIEAGKIVNTHGVRGEVKIEPWVDSPEFLKKFKTLYLDGAPARVVSARVHKRFLIAALEGVGDVNAAMALKNKTVYIDRADARLPKGTFFLADILGARVLSDTGEEIGILSGVLDNPGQRVYVVRGERERLIPAVPEFIRKTDVEGRVVTVRLIEGL